MRFFGVNFILQKFCPCKENDKYKVWLDVNYLKQGTTQRVGWCIFRLWQSAMEYGTKHVSIVQTRYRKNGYKLFLPQILVLFRTLGLFWVFWALWGIFRLIWALLDTFGYFGYFWAHVPKIFDICVLKIC